MDTKLDLFDVGRKRKPLKAEPAPPGAIQNLLSLYRQGYERRFHEPPVILKRDGPLLRNLIQQFGALKVEQRLRAYLAWDDEFVVNSGYALTVFHSNWNRLAARVVQHQAPEQRRGVDETEAYLSRMKAVRR